MILLVEIEVRGISEISSPKAKFSRCVRARWERE